MNLLEATGAMPALDIVALRSGLNKLWHEDAHRLIFWFDPDAEFEDALPLLKLDAEIIRLDNSSALEIKWRLEREDTESRFLLYSPAAPCAEEDDWLLDMRLYSATFRADRASIWLDELGLGHSPSLREHLGTRRKFLNARERVENLKLLVSSGDDTADLDRKMLAVTLGCDDHSPLVIGAALGAHLHAAGGLGSAPKAWEDAGKFGLQAVWWKIVADLWGYSENSPSLGNWLKRALVTDLAHSTRREGKLHSSVNHLLLLPNYHPTNAVFLSQWRDSNTRSLAYDALALEAAKVMDIEPILSNLDLAELERSETFQEVEKALIRGWRDELIRARENVAWPQLRDLIAARLQKHFAGVARSDTLDVPRSAYVAAYEALGAAAQLLVAVAGVRDGFGFGDAASAIARYQSELYRIDQLYRHWSANAARVRSQNWDLLKTLHSVIEDAYATYLSRLGAEWSDLVEAQMLPDWKVTGVPNQTDFWNNTVVGALQSPYLKRVFVIISDGLRYEVAQELGEQLRGKYRFKADLSSQLSVLPSYTALGMAALLPHKKLEARENGDIYADGKSTAGLDKRRAILAEHASVAIHESDFMKLNSAAMRDFVREARVVLIYHDAIDETGDQASTEEDTFLACRRAIDELGALASAIVNKANGNTIFITSDHGFLFTETAPSALEKHKLDFVPPNTSVAKKRYLWGVGLGEGGAAVHAGLLEKTANVQSEDLPREFWVPRGVGRFHFVGGARYFHGGAMPQEVIVPILAVREAERDAAKTQVRPVKVAILDAPRITTNRGRFELLQTESVTDRVQAATVQIGIYEGQTLVSDTQTIRFEAREGDASERQKTVFLNLLPRDYDRKTRYHLVLRHQEDSIEIERREVQIERAFREDF